MGGIPYVFRGQQMKAVILRFFFVNKNSCIIVSKHSNTNLSVSLKKVVTVRQNIIKLCCLNATR